MVLMFKLKGYTLSISFNGNEILMMNIDAQNTAVELNGHLLNMLNLFFVSHIESGG